VANTNVDGNSTIPQGLTDIKGLGIRLGIAITDKLGLPRNKKIGDMTDDEVEKLIELVDKIDTEFPGWMKNRQKDFETGEDLHIISSEIQRSLRDDLNLLKKIRCYRGIRHEQGQKVRGQRTRANGRSGMTVGVMRKKVQQTQKKK
jgi:small subunit ribosomal protein S13